MSNKDVMRNFEKFGSRMLLIALMTLVNLVLSIITWFLPLFVSGLILWIILLGILTIVITVIVFLAFLSAVGSIRKAGMALNNEDLLLFCTKIIIALILLIIGNVLWTIGLIGVGLIFLLTNPTAAVIPYIIVTVIGIILLIICAILTIFAWGHLKDFFEANKSMFPKDVSNDAIKGASYCRIGAILDLTVILMFVGFVFRILGLFKLSSLSVLITDSE